jgi:hypothetical protein
MFYFHLYLWVKFSLQGGERHYPDFESDYETLLKDYMRENANGLQWLKSK